jgi:hypothetical protein
MGTNDFYCGRVQDGLDSALIFINIPLLHALVNAEIISMDATFDTVPFQFYQMASLHAMAYGHVRNCYQFESVRKIASSCNL